MQRRGIEALKSTAIMLQLCCVLSLLLGSATNAYGDCIWDTVIQYLTLESEQRSHRAAENLQSVCATVSLNDIKRSAAAKKCIERSAKVFTETDRTVLQRALGGVSKSTLRAIPDSCRAA